VTERSRRRDDHHDHSGADLATSAIPPCPLRVVERWPRACQGHCGSNGRRQGDPDCRPRFGHHQLVRCCADARGRVLNGRWHMNHRWPIVEAARGSPAALAPAAMAALTDVRTPYHLVPIIAVYRWQRRVTQRGRRRSRQQRRAVAARAADTQLLQPRKRRGEARCRGPVEKHDKRISKNWVLSPGVAVQKRVLWLHCPRPSLRPPLAPQAPPLAPASSFRNVLG
jgi:hypothetical protein